MAAAAVLIATLQAAMAMVIVMLYFFRFVYGEVCTALPLNGGAYNALLNTTSKSTASLAACLTSLSYTATCVVSAGEAVQYLQLVAPSVDYQVRVRAYTLKPMSGWRGMA